MKLLRRRREEPGNEARLFKHATVLSMFNGVYIYMYRKVLQTHILRSVLGDVGRAIVVCHCKVESRGGLNFLVTVRVGEAGGDEVVVHIHRVQV